MKVLNLYAGIGGNRKLWENVEVTAVELNPKIAEIYQDFFPDDKVVVGDAHQYLLDHFGKFDFIWSSPPCPTHSKMSICNSLSPYKDNSRQIKQGGGILPRFPDMKLYEEIIFLKHFFKGKWVVENVIPYYKPLLSPQEIERHLFWNNFLISPKNTVTKRRHDDISVSSGVYGFDISKYKLNVRKDKVLRNCVNPYLGLHILNESKRDVYPELFV